MDIKKASELFKALGDENRILIIQLLSSGEKCACQLLKELQITQPTLSHHMRILCDSSLVVSRKEGKWSYYSISPKGACFAKETLNNLIGRI